MLGSILVFATLLLLALPAAAQAAGQCPAPADRGVAVSVRLETRAPRYRTDLDRRALSRLAGGSAVAGHRGDVLGLTVSSYAVDVRTRHQATPAADGGWCLWPRRIAARLFIPEMTVHVAREFGKASCAYRQILDHEHQHVRLIEAALRAAGPRLEKHLRRAAQAAAPVRVSDRARAEQAIDRALDSAVQSFMTDLDQQATSANLAIDTEASYAKVSGNCRKW